MSSNRDLQKLIAPLIVGQILFILVGIADTVTTSYAGETGISRMALANVVNYLVIIVLSVVATDGAMAVSQYLGSEEREDTNRTASQLFSIAFSISAGITASHLSFCGEILDALFGDVGAEVTRVTQDYPLITSCSFPFLGAYSSPSALFRSMNRTKIIMYVPFLMNITSVAGNAIEIFIFHAGVAGAAVPTPLSRMVATIIMLILSM